MAVDRVTSLLHISAKKKFFQPYIFSKGVTQGLRFYLVKPLTYMNKSGLLFPKLFRSTHMQVSNMVVVCDNMDLAPGVIRIRTGGSDAGHNGLKSIISTAESKGFIRLYIGIGRPETGESVIDHVLGVPDNRRKFDEGIELAATVIMKLLDGVPIQKVMNEFNRKNIRTESC